MPRHPEDENIKNRRRRPRTMFERKACWVALAAFCAALVTSFICLRDSLLVNMILVLGCIVSAFTFFRPSNRDT